MKTLMSIWDIKDGNVHIIKREKYIEAVKYLPDGRYINTLTKAYKKRSIKQHNSNFGIAYKLLTDAFNEEYTFGKIVNIDFVHEFCKTNFLPEEYVDRLKKEWLNESSNLFNEATGEVYQIPFRLTTTKLSTVEQMEYYKDMQKFGSEYLNIDIPDPDPNYKQKK